MLLRRLGGLSAAVSGRLRRPLSTGAAASRPPWAMLHRAILVPSPGLRASFKLAEPPCASDIFVPDHLVDARPRPDPDSDTMSLRGGTVRAVSGDGLLLLDFSDGQGIAPILESHGTTRVRRLMGLDLDPDTTRFVCNPLSGQLFRLPDIDGTKKTSECKSLGLLTRSVRPDGPPDRYAVAELVKDDEGVERGFLMRRFLSPKREWDKLVGLPSPLPFAHRSHANYDHQVLAFGGRLWWVDVSWGAITADPFSDRPELRFVELPRGSVTEPVEGIRMLGRYRRMGVSEGRMHYAEVTQDEPFLLSSFALDDDGSWILQHRVALTRLLAYLGHLCVDTEDKPWIGVIDPLNASIMHLTLGNSAFSVDVIRRKVLGCCVVREGAGSSPMFFTGFLKPCVLPPWLGSSQIPSAGTLSSNRANVKSKTLSDMLVRVDRDKKN